MREEVRKGEDRDGLALTTPHTPYCAARYRKICPSARPILSCSSSYPLSLWPIVKNSRATQHSTTRPTLSLLELRNGRSRIRHCSSRAQVKPSLPRSLLVSVCPSPLAVRQPLVCIVRHGTCDVCDVQTNLHAPAPPSPPLIDTNDVSHYRFDSIR